MLRVILIMAHSHLERPPVYSDLICPNGGHCGQVLLYLVRIKHTKYEDLDLT